MNTIEFTRAASGRPSAPRNVTAGLQGEALILELRTAQTTLDRRRRERLREETPPLRAPSASPERMLHQFPSLGERLDRLDRSLPQEQLPPEHLEQISPKQNEGGLQADHSAAEKTVITPILRASLQAFRARLEWLVSGGRENVASGESFTEQIIRTHDQQLKAASRVLAISAAVAGSWLTLVPLSGAVVLPGKLVVELSVKKI